MALRAKIRPGKAEPEGYRDGMVEGVDEVWSNFLRNPKGWRPFSSFLRPRR
jgi:hypothetical protein